MTYFCLLVSSIIGSWCYAAPLDYTLPGVCQDIGDISICQVEAQELQVRPSYYDPRIEHHNEHVSSIQCQDPCEYMGDGTPIDEGYGRFAACVPGWYWQRVRVYWPDGYYFERQCRDHGGAVVPTCGEIFVIDVETGVGDSEYTCYLPLDLLEERAIMGLLLLLDWEFVKQGD